LSTACRIQAKTDSSGELRDFELDRPLCLLLHDDRARGDSIAMSEAPVMTGSNREDDFGDSFRLRRP
jgi:hypothetical protein